ncbi:MAG TPA: cellulose binding domain-containing protein, partial [Ktedonobacteraceae bacterium]|nr:cellulose binding domain-containing protein [Ktedonobacteraceae bacterium]
FFVGIPLVFLLIIGCSVVLVSPGQAMNSVAAASVPTLVVNANQVLRPVTHVASGGLYGLGSDTSPSDSMVIPLHPKVFVQMAPGGHQLPNGATTPGGDALVVAPKAARAGARVTIRMPDYYPNFPYKWVSWSNWLSVVDGQIAARKAATNITNIEAWELWNEPDWTWNTASAGSFNDGWVRTYREVRSKDSTTPIQGPSYSYYNNSTMSAFLSNAKANNALPNIISWHELSGQGRIASDISAYRALEASLGIGPLPISIEEYAETSEVGIPGSLVGYIAKFERGGIDNAELAFWNQYGTFNDMVINNTQPNGAWWLYKWYGDMSGNMLVTTPPAQTGLDGAASLNSAGNQVSVIVGGGSGANAVTINGLYAFGSSAQVTLEYVPSSGRTGVQPGTTVLSVTNYAITNGSITVPISNMSNTAGYHLLITPMGAATPTATPTHAPTATPTATPTHAPTATPTSGGGSSCAVGYAVTNQWPGGFGASLVITNTGSTAINGWNLQFSFPDGQTITQLWNGSYTQSGNTVAITNVSYNGSIPAGQSLSAPPGFNGSWNGANTAPTSFTLNGSPCSVI